MSSKTTPTVIYITSRGHSGSTLTEMLLAGHSRIVALGELKQLGTDRQEQCRCGAVRLEECRFWRAVDGELRRSFGLELSALSLQDEDDATFADHNEALFRSVATVTGAPFLIDSSKTLERLRRLEASGRLPVRTLHLVRNPYGVVYSNVKLGRDWREHARNYTVGMMKARDWLRGKEVTLLRYEKLAADPQRELARVLGSFGLDLEPGQLDWANQEVHTFAGNPMRVTRDSTIRPDTSWRRGLGLRRILGVAWWTLPTRFESQALYENHRPYWKGEGIDAWRKFRRDRRRRRRPWLRGSNFPRLHSLYRTASAKLARLRQRLGTGS